MTYFTKRSTIANLKSQFRKISKWFYMMCVEIAAFTISTFLACKSAPYKDVKSPLFIAPRKSISSPVGQSTILIRMTPVTLSSAQAKDGTYFSSCFKAMVFALHRRNIPHSLLRQQISCFFGVVFPFKSTHATPVRFMWSINTNTKLALCSQSITATFINIKVFSGSPLLTLGAPFLCYNSDQVLINMDPDLFSCNFLNSNITPHDIWHLS